MTAQRLSPMHSIFVLILLVLTSIGSATSDTNSIVGTWITGDGDGMVEIALQNNVLIGTVVGLVSDPHQVGANRRDVLNPDNELQSRRLLGLTILRGFQRNKKGIWEGGTIYDPNRGNTYRCKITEIGANKLKVRGYLGLSVFGKTVIWNRHTSIK